jgi:hypothetical protein
MKQSQHLLDNAMTCSKLAKRTTDRQMKVHFKRMEDAWRALAREQDWLDGAIPPVDASGSAARSAYGNRHDAQRVASARSLAG